MNHTTYNRFNKRHRNWGTQRRAVCDRQTRLCLLLHCLIMKHQSQLIRYNNSTLYILCMYKSKYKIINVTRLPQMCQLINNDYTNSPQKNSCVKIVENIFILPHSRCFVWNKISYCCYRIACMNSYKITYKWNVIYQSINVQWQ